MNRGEVLTKLAIWLSLAGYAGGTTAWLLAEGRPRWLAAARWGWTLGCALLLVHIGCAFAFYYHWSHAVAYRETARQTNEVLNLNWGGGLLINYLFALAWILDVGWWWIAPATYAHRSRTVDAIWHAAFMFMVFNGTVLFASGAIRWIGLAICLGLAILWWTRRRSAPQVRVR